MNRVNKTINKSKDEFDIFRNLAYKVHELDNQADVILTFDFLWGKVPPPRASDARLTREPCHHLKNNRH